MRVSKVQSSPAEIHIAFSIPEAEAIFHDLSPRYVANVSPDSCVLCALLLFHLRRFNVEGLHELPTGQPSPVDH